MVNSMTRFLAVDSAKVDLKERKDKLNNSKTEYLSLDDIRGYKVYTALLTQSGTDAPVATVLENTIGNIWFGYIEDGVYSIHSNGLFTEYKTVNTLHQTVNLSYGNDGIYYCFCKQQNNELLEIAVYNESITRTNDFLYEKLIEIRVYN